MISMQLAAARAATRTVLKFFIVSDGRFQKYEVRRGANKGKAVCPKREFGLPVASPTDRFVLSIFLGRSLTTSIILPQDPYLYFLCQLGDYLIR